MPIYTRSLLSIFVPCLALSCLFCPAIRAQVKNSPSAMFPVERQHQLYHEFKDFCSIGNTGEPALMEKNAAFIIGLLKSAGLETRLLRSVQQAVPPVVYAEHKVRGAKRTILFYAHYDGQPVNPAQWAPGIAPFEPVLYSGPFEKAGLPIAEPGPGEPIGGDLRLYGRGTGDDKAGVAVIIEAYRSLLREGKEPASNIKFLFEGEEEKGSPHLAEILDANTTLLAADAWIIADGPVHPSGRPQISFGVRGDVNMEITTYGPNRPLHSGHYGNWSPNPAWRLVELLATMRDTTGHVLIRDWYTDMTPFSAEEQAAVALIPRNEEELATSLGLARPEGSGLSQVELLNQPSLNINGIQSADVGALSRNVIPTNATVSLDLRLVLGNDWQRQIDKVVHHVQDQGYHVTDHEPSKEERLRYPLIARITHGAGYNAQRTSMSLPFAQELIRAVKASTKQPAVVLPGMGGSLPLRIIEDKMKVHIVSVPIANYDDNQHAENENLRLQNLWDGILEYQGIMSRL
jgi:acetylornithine deacetylase/succinyl-diaminopimelate desuccinylase-like protein